MPNQLAGESSPYLLQHANNPVHWHPWGPEALDLAKSRDKPIFLSIGYSACHWCHVMEHESFEDERIADVLNEHFISIKVDREERPDLDHIYMNAVQLLTGRGGWPMSVFLTPEGEPFFGGTYWPPTAGRGMPGFDDVLTAVADAWQNRRPQALQQAAELTQHLADLGPPRGAGELTDQRLQDAGRALERSFDFTYGGFGGAPKFPHPMDLAMLLRVWRRWPRDGVLSMVRLTLDKMATGGIYDHLGGGFARYSVDERWLVPHFEKMLYDNALLAGCYLQAYQATGHDDYARVVRETLDYLLRDMTDPASGIYSTEDADSEGEEGKFYVWTPGEIEQTLGADAAHTFCYVYDVSDQGNFEGHNILNLPKSIEQCAGILGRDAAELRAELADARAKLLEVRSRRVRPGRDDKVLVAWNALAIDALARAGGALAEPRYTAAAANAAQFIFEKMRRADGRLLHVWRAGQAKLDAYLDDYACLANALVSLYEATFDERWILEAVRIMDIVRDQFADERDGGFFFTSRDHEKLVTRHKDLYDGSVPSGNAMAATALVRLGQFLGRRDYLDQAEATIRAALGIIERAPSAAGQMLLALDMFIGPNYRVVAIGNADGGDTAAALADLRRRFIPNLTIACRADPAIGSAALNEVFAGMHSAGAEPTVFVCQNSTCSEPISGKETAVAEWKRLVSSP